MIPKTFHLFWGHGPLSYLRYLTIKTLRHHHPDWQIILWRGGGSAKASWEYEQQDFNANDNRKNYWHHACRLADDVRVWENHLMDAPNYQSDFFRWDILNRYGGWYMDFDQIILKPFDDLPEAEFVYAQYNLKHLYAPVGVLGSTQGHPTTDQANYLLSQCYNVKDYGSIGPALFGRLLGEYGEPKNGFNSGVLFYAVPYSSGINALYDGSFVCPETSYAIHLFAGHPDTQKFMATYTPEFAETSNDWISKYIRRLDADNG